MRKIVGVLLFVGAHGVAGCATAVVGHGEPERPLSTLLPVVGLTAVQRPAAAEKRYGAQTISELRDSVGRYRFEDSLIVATFFVGANKVDFELANKSQTPIQIGWSEAAFVDPKGESQPVMHAGVRYTDCSSPKAPSVVVGRGRITDAVVPCNYLRFESRAPANRYATREWIEGDYFPLPPFVYADSAAFWAQRFTEQFRGQTVRLLLPIKNQDFVSDYTFTFELREIRPGPAPLLR